MTVTVITHSESRAAVLRLRRGCGVCEYGFWEQCHLRMDDCAGESPVGNFGPLAIGKKPTTTDADSVVAERIGWLGDA